METEPKRPNWLAMLGGTVFGVITGGLTGYQFLEHRIESRVEARVKTDLKLADLKLAELELNCKSLKDASWTADETMGKRIDQLGGRLDQILDRIAKVESQATAHAAPVGN